MSAEAMQLDASWFAHPDTRSVKVYHDDNGNEFARCRAGRDEWVGRPLVAESAIPLDEVPLGLRCQANGCRQAWPAAASGAAPYEEENKQ